MVLFATHTVQSQNSFTKNSVLISPSEQATDCKNRISNFDASGTVHNLEIRVDMWLLLLLKMCREFLSNAYFLKVKVQAKMIF